VAVEVGVGGGHRAGHRAADPSPPGTGRQREAAIARVSGHVADSLMNMETVRAFAAEDREAAEHQTRVAEQRLLAIRSWDYANLRIDTLVAPMSVLTNALGLFLAVNLGAGQLGVEAIVVTFVYFSNVTLIMFEFNQIIGGWRAA
jgi:ATP-binding cassette subfamily B protein